MMMISKLHCTSCELSRAGFATGYAMTAWECRRRHNLVYLILLIDILNKDITHIIKQTS
jgi:hypothetical protein